MSLFLTTLRQHPSWYFPGEEAESEGELEHFSEAGKRPFELQNLMF